MVGTLSFRETAHVEIQTAGSMIEFHAKAVDNYSKLCSEKGYPMSRAAIEHDLAAMEKYIAEIRLHTANLKEYL